MKTTANVYLIPTEKLYWPNCIWLGRTSKQLNLDTSYNSNPKSIDPIDDSMLPQHLYFTLPQSNLEISKIKKGDYYIVELFNIEGGSTDKHIEQCKSIYGVWINNTSVETTRHIENCEKIIACTDGSLKSDMPKLGVGVDSDFAHYPPLPQIPQSFVEHYIAEYNKGNVIKTVEIELEYDSSDLWVEGSYLPDPIPKLKIGLKLSSNNEISIIFLEEKMYSKDEVITLIKRVLCDFMPLNNHFEEDEDIWIEENLLT
jgi:hypothetical protein